MNRQEIVGAINKEIGILEKARKLLGEDPALALTRRRRTKRVMSEATKRKISKAQKKRRKVERAEAKAAAAKAA